MKSSTIVNSLIEIIMSVILLQRWRSHIKLMIVFTHVVYNILYNNKINARVLIGQSAMVYCAGKPMEKSRVFWIII